MGSAVCEIGGVTFVGVVASTSRTGKGQRAHREPAHSGRVGSARSGKAVKPRASSQRGTPSRSQSAAVRERRSSPGTSHPKGSGRTGRDPAVLLNQASGGGRDAGATSARGYEAWGMFALLAGLLAGLGIYGNASGPMGRFVMMGTGLAFGVGRFALPVGLLCAGALLVAIGLSCKRRGTDPDWLAAGSDATNPDATGTRHQVHRLVDRRWPAPVGALGGLSIAGGGMCGLLEVVAGSPAWTASHRSLRAAGGYVGVAVGGSLHMLAGTAGAAVILLALCLGGIMVAGRLSVAEAASGILTLARWIARRIRAPHWWESIAPGAERIVEPRTPTLGASVIYDAEDDLSQLGGEGLPGSAALAPGIGTSAMPDDWSPEATRDAGEGATCLEPSPKADEWEEIATVPALRPGEVDRTLSESTPVQLDMGLGPTGTPWKLPPMKLLDRTGNQRVDQSQAATGARVLQEALAAHGVETRVTGYTVGPTVTRYEVEIGAGVKVAQVTNLAKDIAYAMASPDVRILAPIPGRSAIGVEVPNHHRQLVSLGDILSSTEARQAIHPLSIALGRDISGKPMMVNLAEMPHVLIAGATGAGKSSCINSLVTSLLVRSTPEQVRLILVDPKRVELGQYNGLPHLLTQVVVDPRKAANALSWAVKEMERRYDLLAEVGVRDITGYNQLIASAAVNEEFHEDGGAGDDGRSSTGNEAEGLSAVDVGSLPEEGESEDCTSRALPSDGEAGEQTTGAPEEDEASTPGRAYENLPFVVIVVDELNDLMMVAARDVEESICRIAQMARAVGIHLVIATQRPSVDVITGVIKANIPSRLAFSVSSLADSRVILDQPGAERLVGRGDMLMLTASSSIPVRVQGPWVSEHEVRKVVAHWRRQGGSRYVEGVEGDGSGAGGGRVEDGNDDEMLMAAMELVVRSQLGSTSMLQRKLRVGFARAGRLMDLLERRGVVGPSEGSKARAVLMTPEELDDTLQRSDR